MKKMIRFAKVVGAVTLMMYELGAGTGFVLLGLRQIRNVVDEHDWLSFWN